MRLTGYSDSRGSLATALRSRVVSHSPGLIDVDENRWNKHERRERLANEAMPHTGCTQGYCSRWLENIFTKNKQENKMLLHSSKPSFKDYFCSRKRRLWRKDGRGTGIRTRQLYAKVQPGPVFVVVEVVDKVRRGAIDQAKQTNSRFSQMAVTRHEDASSYKQKLN